MLCKWKICEDLLQCPDVGWDSRESVDAVDHAVLLDAPRADANDCRNCKWVNLKGCEIFVANIPMIGRIGRFSGIKWPFFTEFFVQMAKSSA